MTWTATTLNILDSGGTSHPVICYTDGTNYTFAHSLLNNAGVITSPATQSTTKLITSSLTRPTGALTYSVLGTLNQGVFLGNASSVVVMTLAGAASTALTGTIFQSKLTRSQSTLQSGIIFRTHFFTATPAFAGAADNVVYQDYLANEPYNIGYIDHIVGSVGADCTIFYGSLPNGPIPYTIASGSNLFAAIEIRGNAGYSALSAEVFTQTITVSVD